MAVSAKTRAEWARKWEADRARGVNPLAEAEAALEAWRADPLASSALRYWLNLEVWTAEEGLLVLTGVEPGTVRAPEDSIGSPAYESEWTSGQPFVEHYSFNVLPVSHDLTREDFTDTESYEAYLEEVERRHAVLDPLRRTFQALDHKLTHSPSALGKAHSRTGTEWAWRPVAFLAWANSIGFTPPWLSWAKARNLLPDPLEPTAVPFFDAESPSYPRLLHIAIRAWEHACQETSGTPKQRIEAFLSQRYSLTASERSAIALVANWKKVGGRPKGSK